MSGSSSSPVAQCLWPAASLGKAIGALAEKASLVETPPELGGPAIPDSGEPASFLLDAGKYLGIEVVPASSPCGELKEMLRCLGPSLLRLIIAEEEHYLAVLRGGSFGVAVLTPQRRIQRLSLGTVLDALVHDQLEAEQRVVTALLQRLDLSGNLEEKGLRAFAMERLRAKLLDGIWLLRPLPTGSVRVHARLANTALILGLLLVARGLSTGLSMLLWALIGQGVFGSADQRSMITNFALCLLSILPLRLFDTWAQGRLTLDAGMRLKVALLYGVLKLDRSALRGLGIGQFLSMAMEGDVSAAAMNSTLQVALSAVELGTALLVLAAGMGGAMHALILFGWTLLAVWLCRGFALRARRALGLHTKVTHDLVERLVGYQTRLMQERPLQRDREEDALLQEYLSAYQDVDRQRLVLDGVMTSGWMILGLASLLPALLSEERIGPSLALSLGGILMGARSLAQIIDGLRGITGVWISWQQTRPILQAGQQALSQEIALPGRSIQKPRALPQESPLFRFEALSLRYAPDAPIALRGCTQVINAGDRILLEGPSGGGKSTLAMVLAGLRTPDSGELLLFERRIQDFPLDRWRSWVVLVPQFHDNHVLTEPLLFNLLLGRRWPATAEDEEAAVAVCEMLSLGPLLKRMPQGMAQMVGDGGWTLSHGERSRVFLARALLQSEVELIILDESFAALDPETVCSASRGVLRAAPALLVIAHP